MSWGHGRQLLRPAQVESAMLTRAAARTRDRRPERGADCAADPTKTAQPNPDTAAEPPAGLFGARRCRAPQTAGDRKPALHRATRHP
jgi:hypothetical protein